MNKINWQAYLDGSLSPEEMKAADQALATQPEARAELEDIQALTAAIKSAAMAEAIPHAKLNAMIKTVVRQNQTPWFARPAVLLPFAALAVAMASAIVLFNPVEQNQNSGYVNVQNVAANQIIDLRKSPFQGSELTSDPHEAAHFAAEKLNRKVPLITLASLPGAGIDEVECGSCWLAYKFHYKGQEYTIYGRQESQTFSSQPRVDSEACSTSKSFYQLKDGIGWECAGGMTYVLKGGDPGHQLEVAEAAAKETPNLVATL